MLNIITLMAFLTAFWLLLSGHYEPLMLVFMVFSVAVVLLISRRMQSYRFEINPLTRLPRIVSFNFWFAREIVMANIAVAKAIWSGKGIRPAIRKVNCSQKTRAGKVLFANAIILTPGTMSIDIDEQQQTVTVHALHDDMLDDLEEGVLDKRVLRVEGE